MLSRAPKWFQLFPGFRSNSKISNFENLNNNKNIIEEYYSSHEDIRQPDINFGNHRDIADKIWRTVRNPVTQEMITGNNIPTSDEEQKYYNRDVKRDKSVLNNAQDFHNKVIKNRILLGSVSNELDIASRLSKYHCLILLVVKEEI